MTREKIEQAAREFYVCTCDAGIGKSNYHSAVCLTREYNHGVKFALSQVETTEKLLQRAYSYLSLIYYRHYRGDIPEDLRPELEQLLNDLRPFGHQSSKRMEDKPGERK